MAKALEAMLREAAEEPAEETTTTTTPDKVKEPEEKPVDEVVAETPPSEETTAETPPEEVPPEEEGDFFAYVKEQFGEDLAEVFKTPEEAVKGLLEARRTIGRRDEDAQYGKAVKELLKGREKQLAAFLAGAKPETETRKIGAPESVEDFPDDAENWALQIREDEKGQLVPAPGAPADIVDKYKSYQRAVQKRLLEIAKSWPKLKTLPDTVEQTAAGIQQQQHVAAEERAILDWQSQYKSVLFVDGDDKGSLTPEGKRVEAEFKRLREENPEMRTVNAFKEATKLVLGSVQRAAKQPPKPKATAIRSEGVAVVETKYKSIEDEVEKRLDAVDKDGKPKETFTQVMMDIKRRLASGTLK